MLGFNIQVRWLHGHIKILILNNIQSFFDIDEEKLVINLLLTMQDIYDVIL
jgi:hypothetical protein